MAYDRRDILKTTLASVVLPEWATALIRISPAVLADMVVPKALKLSLHSALSIAPGACLGLTRDHTMLESLRLINGEERNILTAEQLELYEKDTRSAARELRTGNIHKLIDVAGFETEVLFTRCIPTFARLDALRPTVPDMDRRFTQAASLVRERGRRVLIQLERTCEGLNEDGPIVRLDPGQSPLSLRAAVKTLLGSQNSWDRSDETVGYLTEHLDPAFTHLGRFSEPGDPDSRVNTKFTDAVRAELSRIDNELHQLLSPLQVEVSDFGSTVWQGELLGIPIEHLIPAKPTKRLQMLARALEEKTQACLPKTIARIINRRPLPGGPMRPEELSRMQQEAVRSMVERIRSVLGRSLETLDPPKKRAESAANSTALISDREWWERAVHDGECLEEIQVPRAWNDSGWDD